jgi:hypothetical protein
MFQPTLFLPGISHRLIRDQRRSQLDQLRAQSILPQDANGLTTQTFLDRAVALANPLSFTGMGEAPKPKTIFVRAGKVFPVKQSKVSSSSPDFQTKVQQAGNGEFKIDIEPKQTTHAMVATLTIHADNWAKTFYANARVTNVPVAP